MISVIIVFSGVVLCVLGLIGIISIGYIGIKIKKKEIGNSSAVKNNQALFESLLTANYVALLLSFLGLIIIIVGLIIS
tara:strand:- start:476 stop:709 length:234 start_codon:yes stop_codon:yes gene_type:complete